MGLQGGELGFRAQWVAWGQCGLGLGVGGVVWCLGGLARIGFGLGGDGFGVEAWGLWWCGFGFWGGTGWVRGLVCWLSALGVLCWDNRG